MKCQSKIDRKWASLQKGFFLGRARKAAARQRMFAALGKEIASLQSGEFHQKFTADLLHNRIFSPCETSSVMASNHSEWKGQLHRFDRKNLQSCIWWKSAHFWKKRRSFEVEFYVAFGKTYEIQGRDLTQYFNQDKIQNASLCDIRC